MRRERNTSSPDILPVLPRWRFLLSDPSSDSLSKKDVSRRHPRGLEPAPGKFYGWRIVAALFVILMFSSGLGFYNHAIILQALSRESGFPIEMASFAVSLFFLVSGLTGLAIAPLLELTDVRYVITAGAVLASVCLGVVGHVEGTMQLLIVYSLFGVGFCASGLLPATTLVARWFETDRARALSFSSTGLSVGGITLTPLSATLIEQYSLGNAGIGLGFIYFLGVVPVTWLVLRSSPADLGIRPHGRSADAGQIVDGFTLGQAVKHPFFWGLSFAYIFVMLAQVGGIAHHYGVLTERLHPGEASVGIAVLPLFSVMGRLAGGIVLGHFSTRWFTLCMMCCQASSLLLIAIGDTVFTLYAGLALFGVSVGNLLMLQPLIVAEVYGLVGYTRIYAWSNMIAVVGVAGGPVLMGVLFGYSGSYQQAYIFAGAIGVLAAMIFFAVRPPLNPAH